MSLAFGEQREIRDFQKKISKTFYLFEDRYSKFVVHSCGERSLFEPLWDLSKKDLESRTRGVAFSFFGSRDLCIVRKVGFENSTKNKSCGASNRI